MNLQALRVQKKDTALSAWNLARLLPGLFPPQPLATDAAVRRVLLALLLMLSAAGTAAAVLSRDGSFVPILSLAIAGCLAAAVVPWHRFDRDAFAAVGITAALWTAWLVSRTGGTASPYVPLTYLCVVLLAVPLSLRLGAPLGVAAAVASSLPLLYDSPSGAQTQELLVRSAVQVAVALFAAALVNELRRVVRSSDADRLLLQSEQETADELRRAQSVRQEYLTVLAHELRNPLNGINAAARVLAKQIVGTQGETTARSIASEAHHAMELLDGLTDVASLESGRMRLALRPMDLSGVLTEASGGVVEGHRLSLRGNDQLIMVLGDDRRIGQVIRNLIGNAAKYSPPEAEIQVSVGTSADRRNAIVQVRDAGPGIPPSERHRLFEKFARLSTAGSTRGSGLGLYISRGIVKDHGGEMWADWPAGGGSVFSFSVPLLGESRR